jgi:hypothetical protein
MECINEAFELNVEKIAKEKEESRNGIEKSSASFRESIDRKSQVEKQMIDFVHTHPISH